MTWKSFVGPLAVTSRRRALASALVYGLSLAVRFTSPTGEETEDPAQSVRRTSPMTSVMIKDRAQVFYEEWGAKSAQPTALYHGWPLSLRRLSCGM
jgi:hypothetical protein